jgi:hypothetical protein
VAQLARQREAQPVAAGGGDGEPAGGHDHRSRRDGTPVLERDLESARRGCHRRDAGIEAEGGPRAPRHGHEPITHVAGAVRDGEELARLRLEGEREAEIVLEEAALRVERPAREQPAHQVGRGVAGEAPRRQYRGEHVAAAAAADQDLPAAIGRGLEDQDRGAGPRGVNRRHEARGAGAEHHDRGRRGHRMENNRPLAHIPRRE